MMTEDEIALCITALGYLVSEALIPDPERAEALIVKLNGMLSK